MTLSYQGPMGDSKICHYNTVGGCSVLEHKDGSSAGVGGWAAQKVEQSLGPHCGRAGH